MPTKTEYEISEPRKVYVESEKVFNQMKEQGLLQPFTDYYTPDEDKNLSQLRTVLLWENNKPTTTFNEQTINIDLSQCDGYRVVFRFHTTTETTNIQDFIKTDGVISTMSYNSIFRRNITYSDEGLLFSDMQGYKIQGTTAINDNNYLIPYQIIGLYKQPAIIYTGKELHEGNGIKIENGVVSSKSGLLVCDYTVPSDTSSITINGLDLVADGGVYDIVFAGGSVNGDLYLQTNSVTSGYYYSGFRFHIGSMTRRVYYGASEFLIGESSYNGVITMQVSNNTVYIDVHSSVVRSGDYGNFINNGFAPVSNLTSIKIYATTIYAGMNFKIYKRASNSPIRS